eukprot:TRINITY_DN8525_c0_g1_i1.p2 TRINITY_DN8525_c0_g1~~TRINITY_DN8525_c0_g1_i1.p2  ORF type:complete len:201 (+),score=53.15 TRINITY_DN8525_c0_g1_i1:71-673(+)
MQPIETMSRLIIVLLAASSRVDAVNLRLPAKSSARQLASLVSSSLRLDRSQDGQANRTISLIGHKQEPADFEHPYVIDEKRCLNGTFHVGCVYDTQIDQRRWYHDSVAKEDRQPMTVELCYDFCVNVTGVQYFGLKRGEECYCTPFFHNTDKGAHGQCDQPCAGDDSVTCGGVEMVDIYEMHDCNNLPPKPCKKIPQVDL